MINRSDFFMSESFSFNPNRPKTVEGNGSKNITPEKAKALHKVRLSPLIWKLKMSGRPFDENVFFYGRPDGGEFTPTLTHCDLFDENGTFLFNAAATPIDFDSAPKAEPKPKPESKIPQLLEQPSETKNITSEEVGTLQELIVNSTLWAQIFPGRRFDSSKILYGRKPEPSVDTFEIFDESGQHLGRFDGVTTHLQSAHPDYPIIPPQLLESKETIYQKRTKAQLRGLTPLKIEEWDWNYIFKHRVSFDPKRILYGTQNDNTIIKTHFIIYDEDGNYIGTCLAQPLPMQDHPMLKAERAAREAARAKKQEREKEIKEKTKSITPEEARALPAFRMSLQDWERNYPSYIPYDINNPDTIFYGIIADNDPGMPNQTQFSRIYNRYGEYMGNTVGNAFRDFVTKVETPTQKIKEYNLDASFPKQGFTFLGIDVPTELLSKIQTKMERRIITEAYLYSLQNDSSNIQEEQIPFYKKMLMSLKTHYLK